MNQSCIGRPSARLCATEREPTVPKLHRTDRMTAAETIRPYCGTTDLRERRSRLGSRTRTATLQQTLFYEDNGYLLIMNQFSCAEISRMKCELPRIYAVPGPQRILETDGCTVRSVCGCHTESEAFMQLVRDERVLRPAQQLTGGDVCVYQFKISAKQHLQGTCGNGTKTMYFG
jgi:Phytanoyl-CoA dioxygenase (PhyH)